MARAAASTIELLQQLLTPEGRNAIVNSWPSTRCSMRHCERAATGLWMCRFSTSTSPYFRTELRALCASDGLSEAYQKWNGFMSPKLLRIDLFLTISAPLGDTRTPSDHLLEKIASHPLGDQYIAAWKAMFKPSNVHHPISPAFDMLQALVERLFPPSTNKVD
jgi:hypothetical protein